MLACSFRALGDVPMNRGPVDTDINAVLMSPDKRVQEASDILSRMYRTILRNNVLGWQKWNTLLTHHLDRSYGGVPVSIDKITNDRGNLRKALGALSMTWPTFCKGMDILNPQKATFKIILETHQGEVSEEIDILKPTEEGEVGALAILFRSLCEQTGRDYTNLSTEIDAYLNNPRYRVKTHGRQRGNDKGNLKRELVRDDITFDVLKKGLRALDPVVTHFIVTMTWTPTRVTTHPLRINTPV